MYASGRLLPTSSPLLSFLFSFFIGYLLLVAAASAQSQPQGIQAFLTWEARAYAPASYRGRVLPPPGGAVLVGLGATNAAGVFLDLSRYQITWYQNGKFLESGVGQTTILPTMSRKEENIRVIIYGDGETVLAEVSTNIPTTQPYVVLVPEVTPDDPSLITLRLLPFSWSIKELADLTVQWNTPTGTPGDSIYTVQLPTAPNLGSVGSVLIQNPGSVLEYTKRIIRLPYATFEQ